MAGSKLDKVGPGSGRHLDLDKLTSRQTSIPYLDTCQSIQVLPFTLAPAENIYLLTYMHPSHGDSDMFGNYLVKFTCKHLFVSNSQVV